MTHWMIRQRVTRKQAVQHYQTLILEESFKLSKRLSDMRLMLSALESKKTLRELYELADPMQLTGEEHWSHFWWDLSWIEEEDHDVRS